MDPKQKTIGIIGGMGPYAGLDVVRKFYKNTIAEKDNDHLDVVYISLSSGLSDRTDFLLGKTNINPGETLAEKLSHTPLDIIGIACNTFHAAPIFDVFVRKMKSINPSIQIVNLPTEVVRFMDENRMINQKIGVLSSLGAFKTKIYQDAFHGSSHHLMFSDDIEKENIHKAIYHPDWGVKATGALKPEAKEILEQQVQFFAAQETGSILLACTELPLIKDDLDWEGINTIDPNLILARALIRELDNEKLRPLKLEKMKMI